MSEIKLPVEPKATKMVALAALLTPLLFGACSHNPVFSEPLYLADGREIPPETLEKGRIAYTLYCRACHGDNGDGKGPAAPGLRPPPRDFRQGKFKFAAVASGELPNDDDLKRIIKGGLQGTAMLPWDIPDDELDAIIQYIKTFRAPGEEYSVWEEREPGTPIRPTPDPFAPQGKEEIAALVKWRTDANFTPQTEVEKKAIAREMEAIQKGEKVYHVLAQCISCHPAYATKQEIYDMSGGTITEFRANYLASDLKDSDYKYPLPPLPAPEPTGEEEEGEETEEEAEEKVPEERFGPLFIMPPDFTFDNIRSGTTFPDLYRSIASGIGGTAMPSWRGALPEEDIWAMVHYVAYLIDLKNHPETGRLAALRKKLAEQPEFRPPTKSPTPSPASEPGSEPASEPASDSAPVDEAAPAEPETQP